MTKTITDIKQGVPGDLRFVEKVVDITSYTASGEPLGAEELGLSKLVGVFVQSIEKAYVFVHDDKNDGKAKAVLQIAGTNAPGTITVTIDGKAITVTVLAHNGEPADTLATIAAKMVTAINAVKGQEYIATSDGVDTVTVLSRRNKATITCTFGAGDTGVTCTPALTYPILRAFKVGGSIANFTPQGTVNDVTHVFTGTPGAVSFTGAMSEASGSEDVGQVKVLAMGYP